MRRECDENKQTHQQREWALHVWVIGDCFIVSRIWKRLFHYSRQFCWLLACIKSNSNPWETLNIVCAHLWLRLRLAFTLTDAYFDFLVAVRAATPLKHWVVLLYFVLHVFLSLSLCFFIHFINTHSQCHVTLSVCSAAHRKPVHKFIIEITITANRFGQVIGRQWDFVGIAYSGKTSVISMDIQSNVFQCLIPISCSD